MTSEHKCAHTNIYNKNVYKFTTMYVYADMEEDVYQHKATVQRVNIYTHQMLALIFQLATFLNVFFFFTFLRVSHMYRLYFDYIAAF